MVKASLETMDTDPLTAAQLLYTITDFSNELFARFGNKHALSILQEKAKSLKVDEYPQQAKIIGSD